MPWIWPDVRKFSLSARLLTVFVLGLWSAQTLFLVLDTALDNSNYHYNAKKRAIAMFALQAEAFLESPDVTLPVRTSVPASRRSRFWTAPGSLFEEPSEPRDARLEEEFQRELEDRGLAVRELHAAYVSAPEPRTQREAREQFSAPRTPPSETYIALLPEGSDVWVNADIGSFARPDAVSTQDILLNLAVFLLVGGTSVVLIARQFRTGLQNLHHAAEEVGWSESPAHAPIDGPVEFHSAIEALNRSRLRVAELIEQRNTMLGAISHELKTPMTSLRLRVEGIGSDDERRRAIATVDDMTRLLDDILALARLDHIDGSGDRYDLSAILADVVADEQERGHDVSLDCKERLVAVVRPAAIRRLLHNVIGNAAVYAGSARVTATREGDVIRIVVEDDGPGVPEASLDAMLSPFRRGELPGSRDTKGAGLGLAIARVIVDGHGGQLSLSNKEPTGLRVEITLPNWVRQAEPGEKVLLETEQVPASRRFPWLGAGSARRPPIKS